MRSRGNAVQWVNGYPSEELLRADVAAGQLYVMEDAGGVAEYWEQRLKDGPSGAGSSGPTDGGDWDTAVTWQQEGTLALSEWAQSYTLRAYSAWEKTRYDTHTIRMTQKN